MPRIAIAGDIGSGKTTVAQLLAERLKLQMLSTGGIQRQLAAARGISTLELNRLAEADPTIDRDIDSYLRGLVDRDIVVESRMAWFFVPDTTKVFLYIARQEAAARIIGADRRDEKYNSSADAISFLAERRRSEINRFRKYYSVDIDDLTNYDLVIDTTFAAPAAVAEKILENKECARRPALWLDPRNLVPTRCEEADLGESSGPIADIDASARITLQSGKATLGVVFVDHAFFIVHEHGKAAAAVRAGLTFVCAALLACDEELVPGRGVTARELVRSALSETAIHAWEKALGFEYKYKLWEPVLR